MIYENRVACLRCGSVLVSRKECDSVTCSCGYVTIAGGLKRIIRIIKGEKGEKNEYLEMCKCDMAQFVEIFFEEV